MAQETAFGGGGGDDQFPSGESYGSYTAAQGSFLGADASLSADDGRARILLMGPRRSGKSSIQKVVFHKMSPHETLFLESTNEVRMKDISTSALVQFQLLDFPGNFDFSDKKSKITPEKIFKRSAAASTAGSGSSGAASTVLVFVIDAQDDETYSDAYEHFITLARAALKVNPKIEFDVLIHKVDGDAYASEDHKTDCQRDIIQAITDELADAKLSIRPTFHMTSIYDHTIFEAFSKIVQKLIPHFSVLEKLLDSLIQSCGIEKTFLFDVVSKIYVATDSNPVDMQTYELCSDMIDVVIDVSCIYGMKGKGDVLSYDADSASVITLSNNYILYLREVNKYLALVCMMPADSFSKAGLVEYNFLCFKKAITQLFEAKLKSKLPTGLGSGPSLLGSSVAGASAADAKDMKTAPATTAASGTTAVPAGTTSPAASGAAAASKPIAAAAPIAMAAPQKKK